MIWHVAWYDHLTMTGLVQGSIFGTSTGRKLPLPASQRKGMQSGAKDVEPLDVPKNQQPGSRSWSF
jgi:hypothetical protein